MINKYNKVYNKKWQYDISRNVQFWHDELSIKYSHEGFGRLELPGYHNLRIHRGIHADFYYPDVREDVH